MNDQRRELSWMVPRSDELCMIMYMDDEERARMSCGHPIMPQSLFDFCNSEVKSGKTEFNCPYVDGQVKCERPWHLSEIRMKACLSVAENALLEEKLSENLLSKDKKVQQCPACLAWSARQSENTNCVRCVYCQKNGKKSDFCWKCLKTWVAEGNKFCGNAGCSTEDEALAILRTCPMKEINNVMCPSKRACPSCGALIEHEKGCYKINCTSCKKDFCFICLQIAGYNHKNCKFAPRQTRLL
ncbi:hypothetical protein ScPMuIL_008990 [Solemya velum]